MSFRVVVDSCAELTKEMAGSGNFVSVPLTLRVDDTVVLDDESLDRAWFLKKIAASQSCPGSSCPSPEAYRKAYACGAEHIYAVTLSAELSGSYNSAQLGKELLLEKHPDAKIHVFNSRSASVGQTLIARNIAQLESEGLSFEEIVRRTEHAIRSLHTWFVLENLDTLRRNGRLGTVKAFVASALKIRPILCATPEGTIGQVGQARGTNQALVKMVDLIAEKTGVEEARKRTLAISHCSCPERARMVRDAIRKRLPFGDVILLDTGGVSTLYANEGGIIVAV